MLDAKIQEEIKSITQQIIKKYKPEKIVLFGSAAWGKFSNDSDLDFLIIKKDTPYLGRDRMREVYKLIDKNVAADFLIYRPNEYKEGLKAGDPFLKVIASKGKVLYG
ncbi:MAG: DNA polymerase beta domain-containing protein region [Candidatus Saganbacteria bacterium]|uniref:DNA polymerase beta domain-containing protein region n=1 Tax=Candidatus Saganbacteria bacterium TaxID=2575572 RepID=A0A833L011_UNCSA|nr:MAG: DNA polymerase beta domain-containing protein region [Candidatus Saganbacteria bacterium]